MSIEIASPTILAQKIPLPPSALKVALATVRKELKITRRYLPNLLGNLVQLSIRVLFFLLMASTATFRNGHLLSRHDMFIFFLSALLLWIFIGTAINTPLNTIGNDLMNGTLEYLYTNPISRYAYYVGSVLASAFINLTLFIPLYVAMLLMAQPTFFFALGTLSVCLAMMATLIAFGVMIGLLALLWRQVNSLAGILFILFEFLAGAYLPVAGFPKILQWLSYGLPFTWGYDLVRFYSLNGHWQTLAPVGLEWSLIGFFAVFYTAISLLLLKKAEKQAKQRGLHLI
jgi:ABC-2 type transport system permease protein